MPYEPAQEAETARQMIEAASAFAQREMLAEARNALQSARNALATRDDVGPAHWCGACLVALDIAARDGDLDALEAEAAQLRSLSGGRRYWTEQARARISGCAARIDAARLDHVLAVLAGEAAPVIPPPPVAEREITRDAECPPPPPLELSADTFPEELLVAVPSAPPITPSADHRTRTARPGVLVALALGATACVFLGGAFPERSRDASRGPIEQGRALLAAGDTAGAVAALTTAAQQDSRGTIAWQSAELLARLPGHAAPAADAYLLAFAAGLPKDRAEAVARAQDRAGRPDRARRVRGMFSHKDTEARR